MMLQAIDIHGHFGDPECFPQKGMEKAFLQMDIYQLRKTYEREEIVAACFSPMEGIFPQSEKILLKANENMAELSEKYDWFYQWVVVDPLYPSSYRQAEMLLKNKKCLGIKLHPDAHGYEIKVYGEEIFAFCNAQKAIVLSHSGEKMSLPESMVPFADRYPDIKIIAAHLGCGYDGDVTHQVNAIKAAKHGNIYTDVSSARSLLNGLVEWAAEQVPCEKILFGTDTPLHHVSMMKRRIEMADLSDKIKESILLDNTKMLFQGVF